ncbi:MAG: hypothetical protein GF350_11735 [Chitinivibrionales bacterium]|nr:hypothetical protein [Chitinivibrionales bacterium]
MSAPLIAQSVFYSGTTGNERFYCSYQLSNGDILIGGKADNLDWVTAGTPIVELSVTCGDGQDIPEYDPLDAFQGKYAFVIQTSADLSSLKKVFHFPEGYGGAVRDIKATSVPGSETGDIFLSGLYTNASNSTPAQAWVGRLDNNFVNAAPTKMSWIWTQFRLGGGKKEERFMQNWDVGSDGKVVYFDYKRPSAGAWGAVYRLKTDGSVRDTVPNWWDHGPYCVSLKPANGDLRSENQADFDLVTSHSGVGKAKKKGKYPHDYYFQGPGGINDNGGGYTGYRSDGKAATTCAIAIDRRNNRMYIGWNTPVANNTHDFEPNIMAMKPDGELIWYSHLYSGWVDENDNNIVDDGETQQSPPDHYVDGIAVDYSKPLSSPDIITLARSHGNAPRNLWNGTNSFHNRFTGTNGNEHLCWIGRFKGNDGIFVNASWQAEYDPWSGNFGAPYDDPVLDGWPDHNAGWADLKTTKSHSLTCDMDGNVYVIGNSRGPVTTSNAYIKAANPLNGGAGCWTDFVRVFKEDLSTLAYSSMFATSCDTSSGNGGGNVKLHTVLPVPGGLITCGYHTLDDAGEVKGGPLPVLSIPSWGTSTVEGEQAMAALLTFSGAQSTMHFDNMSRAGNNVPVKTSVTPDGVRIVTADREEIFHAALYSMMGKQLIAFPAEAPGAITVPGDDIVVGNYILRVTTSVGEHIFRVMISE